MTTIDQIPDLRAILIQLENTIKQTNLEVAKLRDDSLQSIKDVNQRVDTTENTVGDTAERARTNLKAIDDLTQKTNVDVKELQETLGNKGRIELIENKLGATYDTAMKALEAQRIEVVKKVAQIDVKILDFETASVENDTQVQKIKDDLERRTNLLEGAVNGAYAAVQSVQGSGNGSGGGGKSGRSLSQEKALESIGKILGNESVTSLLEWKRKLMIIIDTVLPGAYIAFEVVEKSKIPIGATFIGECTTADAAVMSKLNSQLYALMMVKMGGRAEILMKSMDHRLGLEAWRLVWSEIGRKDELSLHAEFMRCTDPRQTKKLSELSTDILRWEKRMVDMASVNADEYNISVAHKMTIMKQMLPTELVLTIKNEQAKGLLLTFESMRAFVMNSSKLAFSLEQSAAPETALNHVSGFSSLNVAQNSAGSPPTPPESGFTDSQCEDWVQEEAGWQYHTENPNDEQISRAVLAIVKGGKGGKLGGGKDKGGRSCDKTEAKPKGKGKGKGKGFQGDCHNCGVFGHSKYWCTKPGGGKGGKGVNLAEGEEQNSTGNKNGKNEAFCVSNVQMSGFMEVIEDDDKSEQFVTPPTPTHQRPGKGNVKHTMCAIGCGCQKSFEGLSEEPIEHSISIDYESTPTLAQSLLKAHPKKPVFKQIKKLQSPESKEIDELVKFIQTKTMKVVKHGKKSKIADEYECDDEDVKEEIRQRLMALMPTRQVPAPGGCSIPEVCNMLEKGTKSGAKAEVNPVETRTKKVRVAVAMDTGATTNASPNGVFGTKVTPVPDDEREDLYGADNNKILNLGTQVGKGVSEQDDTWSINFDIAKISRPLGSVSKLLKNNHRAMFDEGNSYIQNKSTGKKTKLREEGGLFFLDLVVEVPFDMPINKHFVRPVQS